MKGFVWGLLLAAATAGAQEAPSVSVIVPVVGSSAGALDTRWKTDIELHNDAKSEATVALTLPTAKDQPAILLTIPGGGVQRFTDVAGEAFGLDNVLSPLVVQTLGRRSVRVIASAYAIQGGTVTKPQDIPIIDAGAYFPQRTLSNLSYTDSHRTNLGLINLGEQEAIITMALRSAAGDTVSASRSVLPANTMWHLALQLLFPGMPQGDGYSVLIETGMHDTYVYASVIDNSTNDAEFVLPAVGVH